MPITNGLTTMPLACKARLTAQGSSSQASIPSVMRMITFRPGESGKSEAACSKDLAIGVVPCARIRPRVCLMIRLLALLKGTTSSVSSQSCWPEMCLVPCPYTLSPNSNCSLWWSSLRVSLNRLEAVSIFRRPPQNAFMLFEASKTNKMRVGRSSPSASTCAAQGPGFVMHTVSNMTMKVKALQVENRGEDMGDRKDQ